MSIYGITTKIFTEKNKNIFRKSLLIYEEYNWLMHINIHIVAK